MTKRKPVSLTMYYRESYSEAGKAVIAHSLGRCNGATEICRDYAKKFGLPSAVGKTLKIKVTIEILGRAS